MKNQTKTNIKTLILLPFLAILLTVFTVSFISKSDENLFKEFQKNFKTAKLPLKVQVTDNFNEKNQIDAKFSEFFSREMQTAKYSRMPTTVRNEYLQIVAQNENMVAVIVGVSSSRGFAMKKIKKTAPNGGNYFKLLVTYDKKGTVLDSRAIAYKNSNTYINTEIKADLTFSVQEFVNENDGTEKDKKKFTLEKTDKYLITASGKIVDTNEDEEEKEQPKQIKSL